MSYVINYPQNEGARAASGRFLQKVSSQKNIRLSRLTYGVAIEYISQIKNTQDSLVRSQDALTREVEALRNESQSYMAMRAELENLRMELQAAQGYHHPQQNTYHPQNHHQPHNSVNGGPGRMQGIERC